MGLIEAESLQHVSDKPVPLVTKPSPRIGQLERDIGNLESKIAKLAEERQSILDEQAAKAPELKLARSEEKRGMLKEGIRSKLVIRNRLREIDDEVRNLNTQLGEQNKKLSQTAETESQLKGLLRETEGIPASIRDVGQVAVIGAQGKVPFSIGKVLLPSPKTRIQVLNKIKNRFANPSLNSSLRMALERPVTLETVRQLATTHKVSEPELTDALIGSGVQIVDLLGNLTSSEAEASGGSSIMALPTSQEEEASFALPESPVPAYSIKSKSSPSNVTAVDSDYLLEKEKQKNKKMLEKRARKE
jgi:hypothetical protein